MKKSHKSKSSKRVVSRAAAKEIQSLDRDEAMEVVLPFAKDTVPYARRDLSAKLTKTLKSWSTRGLQSCMFKENVTLGAISQSATAVSFSAFNFTLGSVGNINAYASLFDQYRFRAVVVTATPTILSNTANPTITYMPRLYSIIDYDDSTNPTSISAFQRYDSCMMSSPCTAISRIISPHEALAAYSGSFASYANVENVWFDLASPSVQHYGIKFAIEVGAASQTILQFYELEAVFFFECRSQR